MPAPKSPAPAPIVALRVRRMVRVFDGPALREIPGGTILREPHLFVLLARAEHIEPLDAAALVAHEADVAKLYELAARLGFTVHPHGAVCPDHPDA